MGNHATQQRVLPQGKDFYGETLRGGDAGPCAAQGGWQGDKATSLHVWTQLQPLRKACSELFGGFLSFPSKEIVKRQISDAQGF